MPARQTYGNIQKCGSELRAFSAVLTLDHTKFGLDQFVGSGLDSKLRPGESVADLGVKVIKLFFHRHRSRLQYL
jgi:hypothetical protein